MKARWERIEPFEVGGLWFRVVPEAEANSRKRKGNGHMVIEFYRAPGEQPDGWHPGAWIPVPMSFVFLLCEFFGTEEDYMFPRVKGNMGGDMIFRYAQYAYRGRGGWRTATAELEKDVARKAARISRPWRTGKNPNVSADSWQVTEPSDDVA